MSHATMKIARKTVRSIGHLLEGCQEGFARNVPGAILWETLDCGGRGVDRDGAFSLKVRPRRDTVPEKGT